MRRRRSLVLPLLHDLDERWIVQPQAYDTTAASFFYLAHVLEDIKKCIAGVSPSHGVMKKKKSTITQGIPYCRQ